VTTKSEDIFADKEVDAVAISTPLSTHYPLAKQALVEGKHVFLEKPITASSMEASILIELAEAKQLILMVDHTFLYSGAVTKIKELIEQGELGDLYYFDSERINLGLWQHDCNVIWDLAPHDISIMNYLLSPARPTRVLAIASRHINQRFEEMAHLTINFDSGSVAHIHVSWLSPVKIRKILIGGSRKMVVYDDINPSEKVKVYDKGVLIDPDKITALNPLYRSGDVCIPKLDDTEPLWLSTRHFLDCIQKKEKPKTDARSGLAVVKILEACKQSLEQKTFIDL
jgi:predicted dehydrogenase